MSDLRELTPEEAMALFNGGVTGTLVNYTDLDRKRLLELLQGRHPVHGYAAYFEPDMYSIILYTHKELSRL